MHPGCEDDRLGLPRGAERAGEDEIVGVDQRRRRPAANRAARDRLRLARERRRIDLHRARDQPRVGGEAIALADQQQVARHQLCDFDLDRLFPAPYPRPRRQVLAQRLGGPLRLQLLGEGEDGVEDDHRDDRRRQGEDPGGGGKRRGDPEQQRQRVGELQPQVAEVARPPAPLDLVRPVLLEPPARLARGEAGAARPQMPEDQIEPLLGVEALAGLGPGQSRRPYLNRSGWPLRRATRSLREPSRGSCSRQAGWLKYSGALGAAAIGGTVDGLPSWRGRPG